MQGGRENERCCKKGQKMGGAPIKGAGMTGVGNNKRLWKDGERGVAEPVGFPLVIWESGQTETGTKSFARGRSWEGEAPYTTGKQYWGDQRHKKTYA